jgi:hypothetical protein
MAGPVHPEDLKAQTGHDVDDDAPVIPESGTRSTAVEQRIVLDSPQVVPAPL